MLLRQRHRRKYGKASGGRRGARPAACLSPKGSKDDCFALSPIADVDEREESNAAEVVTPGTANLEAAAGHSFLKMATSFWSASMYLPGLPCS